MKRMRWVSAVLVALACTCAAVAQTAPVQTDSSGCATALLVIDMQYAYIPPAGLRTADGADLVTRLVAVLADARAARIPVIYIKQVEARFAGGAPLGEIVAEIAPLPGDPVIWKPTGDAFFLTNLGSLLAGMGVHRVVICGLATHGCVDATLYGAIGGAFETWVIADAHGDMAGPGLETYYNTNWPILGVHVVPSTEIDFSEFGCASPIAP
ncbi:MAG: cysteine hydrolase [Candidatus Bipolaricaulota bacterium]|nr:cysteine hydrolase [Candidatus Bipolaricaulota bacterium]